MIKSVIVIDGVTGCGKTTLAEKIEKELNIPLYYELGNPQTTSLLEQFYLDQKRWSFTLQIHFLNERFKMIKQIHRTDEGGLLDRSIFGDKIFAEMLWEDGMMSDEEYTTYDTLLDSMLEHAQAPKLLIYIDCPIETALKRIQKRGRNMELDVPDEYWGRLNEKYSTWYDRYDHSKKIKLNADSYHPDNKEDVDLIIEKIKNTLD